MKLSHFLPLLLPLLTSATTGPTSSLDPKLFLPRAVDALAGIVYQSVGIDLMNAKGKIAEEQLKQLEIDHNEGMVRLTDMNYDELVELEELTEKEEAERVWCVLIHGKKSEALSDIFYEAHQLASNMTTSDPNELAHVRFARMDYLNVTDITTRWNVWKPPYIVFVSDRGQTLQFLGPRSIRPEGELLREVLVSGEWRHAPAWDSKFSPKGKYGAFMRKFGYYFAIWNQFSSRVPRFAWIAFTGILSQTMLSFFHRNDPVAETKPKIEPIALPASDKAKALAEAVRRRATAQAEADKLKLQEEEAKRVVEQGSTSTRTRSAKSKK